MKYYFTVLLLFFFTLGFSQEKREITYTHHVATYEVSWLKDVSNPQVASKANYYLLLTDTYSLFTPERNYYIDTLEAMGLMTAENFNTYFKQAPKVSPGVGTDFLNTYKFFDTKSIETFGAIRGNFLIKEALKGCEWKIHSEKQELSGYLCQRATASFSGRDYEAWFTTEIPHRDGPYKFNGLPGLVVKISDTEGHYVFKLIDFKAAKWPVPAPKVRQTQQVSKKEYYEKERDFWNNRTANTLAGGVSSSLPPEEIERRDKAARKRYNPIERIVE